MNCQYCPYLNTRNCDPDRCYHEMREQGYIYPWQKTAVEEAETKDRRTIYDERKA